MRALAHWRAAWGRRLTWAALALLAALAGCSSGEQGGAKREERVVDLGDGVKMSLVLIPPGTFTMGSTEADIKAVLAKCPDTNVGLCYLYKEWFADERPAHKVRLTRAFLMGKHEVTVAQFRRFVEATGYKTDAEKGGAEFVVATMPHNVVVTLNAYGSQSWRNPGFRQTDAHPVVWVSWNDAKKLAEWLTTTDTKKPPGWVYRLATEAEWEYAARGTKSLTYPWGNEWDRTRCDFAAKGTGLPFDDKETDDGYARTAPVGSYAPNGNSPFGVCDMAGNVAEWCEDWYGPYGQGDQADPTGPATGERRVLRGGSWFSPPSALRSALRGWGHPVGRAFHLGFRVVLAPGP